jgi:hypothetical protein
MLLLWALVLLLTAFYVGILVGIHRNRCSEDAHVEQLVQEAVLLVEQQQLHQQQQQQRPTRFPEEMSQFAFGAARVPRDEFFDTFDWGLPLHKDHPLNSQVLLLYNEKAIPAVRPLHTTHDLGRGLPLLNVQDATRNCLTMHVVSTLEMSGAPQCLAIVAQYGSAHIHQWMRLDDEFHRANMSVPLKPVGRGQLSTGYDEFFVPEEAAMQKGWKFLARYMKNFVQTIKQLETILQPVASAKNSVIVMVANLGQSDLLVNFVCNAKSKNLDISNIIVFVTDKKSYNIAKGLGLAAYYDELNYSWVTKGEAMHYADETFGDMMFVKATSVQLVNFLGYNVLFQDLDVVWYQRPLALFEDGDSPLAKFDVIFQDDGARNVRFAPYSANSGFYYVRYNEKTRYLLKALIYNADMIAASKSHQQALIQLITEHSSLYGLRIKTVSGPLLPGGYHYHREKEVMREIIMGEHHPYIFHMCWTNNKVDKILFMQQMGMWFIKDQCEAVDRISAAAAGGGGGGGKQVLDQCCTAEPRILCHFSDKPSVVNCSSSPLMDKRGKPFW